VNNLLADSDGFGFGDSLGLGPGEKVISMILRCMCPESNLLLDRLGLGDYTGLGFGLVGSLWDDNGSRGSSWLVTFQ
jgi:hypothetical protein